AVADDGVRHIDVVDELGQPLLEIETVVEDEVGLRGLADVYRGRLVAVDLRTDLRDRFYLEMLAGDVVRDVGEHREGGEHHGFAAVVFGGRGPRAGAQAHSEGGRHGEGAGRGTKSVVGHEGS